MGAGLDEFCPDLQSVGKAGAGGGEIETPGVGYAELVLHKAGGGREGHVGRDGGDDDDFDFAGVNAAPGEADLRSFNAEIAGGNAFIDDVALANAGALSDPFIAGGDHLCEVCVG